MSENQSEPNQKPSTTKNQDQNTEPQNQQIINQSDTIDSQASAAGSTAEDTLEAYKALFTQQQAAIEEQRKHNESLQAQIEILVRNGAHVGDTHKGISSDSSADNVSDMSMGEQTHQVNKSGEPYVSLTKLGHNLGKRDYKSRNINWDL
jgi:hypothetical protein